MYHPAIHPELAINSKIFWRGETLKRCSHGATWKRNGFQELCILQENSCIYTQKCFWMDEKQTLLTQLSATVPQSWPTANSPRDERLVQSPRLGLSWLLCQLALTIISGNFLFQFPWLSTHSWAFTREPHSKNTDPGKSQGGRSTQGHSKGNGSCCTQFLGKAERRLLSVSTERCSSRKVILTARTELRIQESQKARKKLGFLVLYDIKNRSTGICWSAVPSPLLLSTSSSSDVLYLPWRVPVFLFFFFPG